MKSFPLMLTFASTLLISCGQDTSLPSISDDRAAEITVPLMNTAKQTIGSVTVSGNKKGGVRLNVEAKSISEGAHGMHFHEKADCSSPDFKSAGGHINPMKMQHGLKNPDGPDNADMENAVADKNGNVQLERINPRVSMTGGGGLPALLDEDGSALVIHVNPDDQITQPIGGAGARIACAEIRK